MTGKTSNKYTGVMKKETAEEDVPDPATGLTPREKQAITDSWVLLSKRDEILAHGVELFVIMFREHPYMMSKFSFKSYQPQDLHKDPVMQSHALTVMYSVGSLVRNLNDPEHLVLLANKIAHVHLVRGMGTKYFQDLTVLFPGYLQERAGSAATPLIKQSWTKLLTVLTSIVTSKEQQYQK